MPNLTNDSNTESTISETTKFTLQPQAETTVTETTTAERKTLHSSDSIIEDVASKFPTLPSDSKNSKVNPSNAYYGYYYFYESFYLSRRGLRRFLKHLPDLSRLDDNGYSLSTVNFFKWITSTSDPKWLVLPKTPVLLS